MDSSRAKASRLSRRIVIGHGNGSTVLMPSRGKLVTTTDTLVEGVHFDLSYMSPRELGHKALAILLSDVAAMGAKPLHAHATLGLRQDTSEPFLMELHGGMTSLGRKYRLSVRVGSAVPSPTALIVHTSVIGQVEGHPVSPSGASPGDLLLVSGHVGNSAAGLNCLKRMGRHGLEQHDEIIQAHLRPEPRLAEAATLVATGGVTAMIDVADGLASELHRLTTESGVGALIDENLIPIAESARRAEAFLQSDAKSWALYGGEDFELLVALKPKAWPAVERAMKRLKRKITVIGEITAKRQGVRLKTAAGETVPLQPRLWHHFVRRRRLR